MPHCSTLIGGDCDCAVTVLCAVCYVLCDVCCVLDVCRADRCARSTVLCPNRGFRLGSGKHSPGTVVAFFVLGSAVIYALDHAVGYGGYGGKGGKGGRGGRAGCQS